MSDWQVVDALGVVEEGMGIGAIMRPEPVGLRGVVEIAVQKLVWIGPGGLEQKPRRVTVMVMKMMILNLGLSRDCQSSRVGAVRKEKTFGMMPMEDEMAPRLPRLKAGVLDTKTQDRHTDNSIGDWWTFLCNVSSSSLRSLTVTSNRWISKSETKGWCLSGGDVVSSVLQLW